MTTLTIALILVMLVLSAGLGAFLALSRKPPVIQVSLPPFAPFWRVEMPKVDIEIPPIVVEVDLGQLTIPHQYVVQTQALPPDRQPYGIPEEPIPVEMIEYIDQESDEWARQARRKRLRTLRNELGNWSDAFAIIQREDA